jgi:4-hydroxythreonine-4-phosphate dehydrogenase
MPAALSTPQSTQPTAQPVRHLPIAITPGDLSGIGPEIVAKAFRDAPQVLQGCCVVGDPQVMQRAVQCIGGALAAAPVVVPLADAAQLATQLAQLPPRSLPVFVPQDASMLLNSELLTHIPYGLVSQIAGKYSADCVRWAARAALRGQFAAVVTAPIHKEAWRAAGETCPGHTELLQQEAAAFLGQPLAEVPVRMMLANDELRTVLVSIHLSLREALAAVTYDNVLQTLRITHTSLHAMLGRAPRMAVAGLNPHAGEGGLFGREEIELINPAIATARAEGLQVTGALPPDTVFMQARGLQQFDVVVAMYHDQGLIPVKYLGVEQGVNVTLGLPLVRTSPDHGTAFDIAGKGVADARSLIEAVRQAKLLVGSST